MDTSYRILGLDIGIGSCGIALIDTARKEMPYLGIRLWDVPQEPKTKTSLAAVRRAARSARRNTKRTSDRKKHCLKLFKEVGLIDESDDARSLQSRKGDKPVVKLRARGLDMLLSDREWAQVLYALVSRRGYIPHGEGQDQDTEGRRVLSATKDNAEKLEEEGYRTVGEMFSKWESKRSRNRDGDYSYSVTNELLIDEVNKLFAAQQALGNPHASDSLRDRYLEVMTWRKVDPEYDQKVYDLVGSCIYFPDEKRAPQSSLSSELCNTYERIGHVVIVHFDGREERLSSDTRDLILETIFSLGKPAASKVTYSKLRKMLDLPADSYFKGVESDQEKNREISNNKAWRLFKTKLPTDLVEMMLQDRELADEIAAALTFASSSESLAMRLDELDLSDDHAAALMDLPFNSKLFSGYGHRSLKALNMLIDSFEDSRSICTLYEAEEAAGLAQLRMFRERKLSDQLPPYQSFDPTNRNPVVLRVMSQVRAIVNAISKQYGVPDEIHIELARELKLSEKEKVRIHKANTATSAAREASRSRLAEDLGCDPDEVHSSILRKYEHWEEQGGRCPYCGEPMQYERLISDAHLYEIDHILPYSRTCDDSRANKVLVHNHCNQNKKERTPYEWITQSGGDWEEFALRINRAKLRRGKRERLINTDLSEKEEAKFIERNLNDTRYASRRAKQFLEENLQFPEGARKKRVVAVAGGATATLRNAWGMKKDRAKSNLHHAMDAAVIAACSESAIQRIARVSAQRNRMVKGSRRLAFEATEPWEGFTDEVIRRTQTIIPTRKLDHGVTGRAFEETNYRFLGLNEGGNLARLQAGDKQTTSSNFRIGLESGVVKLDRIAFVRLWWHPEIKVRGRNELGQFLIEPVYFGDIPFINDEDYTPRFIPSQKDRRIREHWDVVPEAAKELSPVLLHAGDPIQIGSVVRRFLSVNISTCTWMLADPQGVLTTAEATKGIALSSIAHYEDLRIINEDILGNCYVDLEAECHL